MTAASDSLERLSFSLSRTHLGQTLFSVPLETTYGLARWEYRPREGTDRNLHVADAAVPLAVSLRHTSTGLSGTRGIESPPLGRGLWRTDRDSNPGYLAVYTLSKRAPSATRPSVRSNAGQPSNFTTRGKQGRIRRSSRNMPSGYRTECFSHRGWEGNSAWISLDKVTCSLVKFACLFARRKLKKT
jgi:hypothetical protein